MKRIGFTLFLLFWSAIASAGSLGYTIKSINAKTGVLVAVPAQPPDGGHYTPVDGLRAFEFTVNDPALLRSLKVGDPITADFAKNLAIVKNGARFPLHAVPPGACCSVTSINVKTGIVTAAPLQPPDGGHYSPVDGLRAFEFTLTNPALLRSLTIGDRIDVANSFAILKSGERFPVRSIPKS